jgi:hypothetical protein
MMGGCIHGAERDHRCYQCEPETPAERIRAKQEAVRQIHSRARLIRDRLKAGKPVSIWETVPPDTVDRLLGLYGLKGDDLYRHAAYNIIQADEYLSMAEAWLRAALECKTWAWDEDQHESCSRLVADIQKRLQPSKND